MTKGYYICFEGAQGSGKSGQITRLAKKLERLGYPVRLFREPDINSDLTARILRRITQDPQYPMNENTAALLFNAARSQSLTQIMKARKNGVICLVDRNYLTSYAVQYYRHEQPHFDYDMLSTIIDFAVSGREPDLTIIQDAPAHVLRERIKERGGGERYDNLPEQELERIRRGYLKEAEKRGYPVINADRPREAIAEDIEQLIIDLFENGPSSKKETTTKEPADQPIENPYITKQPNGNWQITNEGKDFLAKAITDSSGDVYAFSGHMSPTMISAAMARLSRRGDDLRVTLLDEFAPQQKDGRDEELLRRVITAYGDDSVQQLVGVWMVVENASNLLTKKLEWGRLAAYLEQSSRYIYFDQKDEKGHYKFHVPNELSGSLRRQYINTMNAIFNRYSEVVRQLTEHIRKQDATPEAERDGPWRAATRAQACDAARNMLPAATTATVGIYASAQALENMIMNLAADELPEAQATSEQLLAEARKVIPTFLERADKADRGGATIAYRAETRQLVRKLVHQVAPPQGQRQSEATSQTVNLVNYTPKNELDVVPYILHEQTDYSLAELDGFVDQLDYETKRGILASYVGKRLNRRHRPGRAFEHVNYTFDLVCDYGIFRDLQRHRIVNGLSWQRLSPYMGYTMPDTIREAGLDKLYHEAFRLSRELYGHLEEADFSEQAQYATLLGHYMRWKISYNAREAFHIHELRTTPQGHPGYRKLVKRMHDEVARVHPLIAGHMKFVNQDEDPELTRLAAERYTQFKLGQMDKGDNSN